MKFVKKTLLNGEVTRIQKELGKHDVASDEYLILLKNLEKLMELEGSRIISKEEFFKSGIYLAGILLVINHEKIHVISTKAMGLLTKGRI